MAHLSKCIVTHWLKRDTELILLANIGWARCEACRNSGLVVAGKRLALHSYMGGRIKNIRLSKVGYGSQHYGVGGRASMLKKGSWHGMKRHRRVESLRLHRTATPTRS